MTEKKAWHTVMFKFKVNQRVKIIPLDWIGTVYQIIIMNGGNKEYRVRYYINGEQNIEYFQEHELGDAV